MVIKYRCWDKTLQQWRHPHPEEMVSRFTPGSRNAMRIVADKRYEFYLWTGFEDKNGTDVYPGDILDNKYFVNWDMLDGCWAVYSRETKQREYTFAEYKPYLHDITGSIFDFNDRSGQHIS